MWSFIFVLILTMLTSGCGVLLVDVPIKVPIKGQEKFINAKFKTKKEMYIVKYRGEIGYYLHSNIDPTLDGEVFTIPSGTVLKGLHITRVNGWPNGIFFNYVARLEDWKIFQPDFVAQTKMDTKLFYPLDPEFFEAFK